MKRFFQVSVIVSIALAGLFLAMRQIALDNIKLNTAQSMKIAADGFQRKVVEWQSDLQYIARQKEVIFVVSSQKRNPEFNQIEDFFRQFLKLRKDYVTSIRLVDRFGREKIIVDSSGPSHNYMNVSQKAFFQRGISQGAFGAIATLTKNNNKPVLEYSIPLITNGFTVGIVSLGIDISSLTNYFSQFSESLRFNHIYVINDVAQLVYENAITVRPQPRDWTMVKQVYVAFQNSAANLSVLDSLDSIWAFHDNSDLDFSFLLEMDKGMLWQEVLDLYIPVASIFVVAIFLILLTKVKRRRYVRKGALVVPEEGGKGRRGKKSNDPGVRLRDLANISQEIRSPLSNVLGMLSLLRVSNLNSKQKEHLDLATRYSEWILEIINEITDFSALKKGKLKLEKLEFNIRQTIRDVTEILSIEAYKKGIEIFSLVSADVPERIVGDPTRLRQILINLIGNGIKFTESGDVSVNVSTEKFGKGKVVLRIEVTDTGVGVDEELQHTVFTEFEKTEVIPDAENSGLGLGLSITKQLVEMMSGKIGFRSNALGGSTFWLSIPYRIVSEEAQGQAKGKLNGLMVYMLGENASNRKSIANTMSSWGMSCDTSGNFENAISIMTRSAESNRPYDILLIDISVSSATQRAFDIVSQLRQMPMINDTKVLLLTAKGVVGDSLTAKELQIGAYLTKPINRNDLKQALVELNVAPRPSNELVTRHSLKENAASVPQVLVVEKNRTFQKQIVGMLSRLGVDADLAESEKEGLEAVKTRPYQLLIADFHMQELDVLEFIQSVRRFEQLVPKKKREDQERALKMNIVLLTNALTDKDLERCSAVGADSFLEKPLSIDRFAHLLSSFDLIEGEYFSATEIVTEMVG